MGVAQLWEVLEDVQLPNGQGPLVKRLYGSTGQQGDIVAEVTGKTVAIDLSVWIFQVCTSERTMAALAGPTAYTPHTRKVARRTCCWGASEYQAKTLQHY